MNRIDARFEMLAKKGERAFIPYIVAGDPNLERTAELVLELDRVGADVIELGVPFSDPVADGVANQEGALRALSQNVSLRQIIPMVAAVRKQTQVPILLFTYYNPVLAYGVRQIVEDCASAGVDGILCVDLPPEEAAEYKALMNGRGLSTVFLIAPTSTEERVQKIARHSSGFIYYVSRTGVTGERDSLEDSIKPMVTKIKQYSNTPVAVGFGVSKPEHARQIAEYADGVVVGSAIVRLVGELGDTPEMIRRVGLFVKSLVDATKGRPVCTSA